MASHYLTVFFLSGAELELREGKYCTRFWLFGGSAVRMQGSCPWQMFPAMNGIQSPNFCMPILGLGSQSHGSLQS